MTDAITIQESARLVELEGKIASGLKIFTEVGQALAEVRAMFSQKVGGHERWESIGYTSFEDYCRRKWNMSKQRANQLVSAASVVEAIEKTTTMVVVPETERQARPLTKLPAEQQPAAWEKAVEKAGGEQPTAKQVEEAVVEVLEPEPAAKLGRIPDIRSHGLRYSMLAIQQLEKIHPKDTQRNEAFDEVITWINKNR